MARTDRKAQAQSSRIPRIQHYKASGRATVLLSGRCIYLGEYGTPPAERAYARQIAEWLARGRTLSVLKSELTIVELNSAFLDHANRHYRGPDGKPTGELHTYNRNIGVSPMASGHGEKRTRKQEQAIAALLECQTIQQAAAKVGVAEQTLRRWMKDPEFQDAYRRARTDCVDRAVARLEKGFEFAVAVLQKVAGDTSAAPYARVAAAKGLIDSGFKAIEMMDVAERLRRIEDRLLADVPPLIDQFDTPRLTTWQASAPG